MGAVFAGVVRAPITSIVIIFEMTNNYSIILPLMAANIASYAVARRLSPKPIYDALLIQDGIHLPHGGGRHLKRLRAGAAMRRNEAASEGDRDLRSLAVYVHPDQTLDGVLAIFGRTKAARDPGRQQEGAEAKAGLDHVGGRGARRRPRR